MKYVVLALALVEDVRRTPNESARIPAWEAPPDVSTAVSPSFLRRAKMSLQVRSWYVRKRPIAAMKQIGFEARKLEQAISLMEQTLLFFSGCYAIPAPEHGLQKRQPPIAITFSQSPELVHPPARQQI